MSKHETPLSADDASRPLNGVELVIFDFDGVVADSEVLSLNTLQRTLADYGLDWPLGEVRARFLGSSLGTIADFVEQQTDSAAGFGDAWQARLFAQFRGSLQPVTGVLDMVEALRNDGVAYCVASSSSLERIGVSLEAMNLTNAFERVFSAQQVARGKPAPDLFLHAAREMQTAPEACLVVEDSPHGIRAAKAAGMRAVGFLGGTHLRGLEDAHGALLRDCGAERAVTTLAALLRGER